jgi:hypothetical protein
MNPSRSPILALLPHCAATLILAATALHAEDGIREDFRNRDGNGDGFLSGNEADPVLMQADANHDGKLTFDEFVNAVDIFDFVHRDLNEDGWLSGKEMAGLDGYDADNNGEITRAEFLAKRLELHGKIAKKVVVAPGVLDLAGKVQQTPRGSVVADAAGNPVPLPVAPLASPLTEVRLAISADGTFHVLGADAASGGVKLRYFSSKDGATWTAPVLLSPEDGYLTNPFDYQIIAERGGAVYALYSVHTRSDQRKNTLSYNRTIFFRTLAGGQWSAPAPIGTPEEAYGWTAMNDPAGGLRLVWSERVPVPGKDGKTILANCPSGRLRAASLRGGVLGAPVELIEPKTQLANGGFTVFGDSLDRPRGFVGADGSLHLVLERCTSLSNKNEDKGLVYFDGKDFSYLLPYVGPNNAPLRVAYPAELFPGTGGAERVVVPASPWRGLASIVEYPLPRGGNPGAPVVIVKLPETATLPTPPNFVMTPTGETFCAYTMAPQGDRFGGAIDFYLQRGGTTWSPPINVTDSPRFKAQCEAIKNSAIAVPCLRTVDATAAVAPDGTIYALGLVTQEEFHLFNETNGATMGFKGKPGLLLVRVGK